MYSFFIILAILATASGAKVMMPAEYDVPVVDGPEEHSNQSSCGVGLTPWDYFGGNNNFFGRGEDGIWFLFYF